MAETKPKALRIPDDVWRALRFKWADVELDGLKADDIEQALDKVRFGQWEYSQLV